MAERVMSRIDEESKLPYYLQLKKIIMEDILSGELLKGEEGRIPPSKEIAKMYGISVVTVWNAVSELIQEKVLYARPKKGIFLTPSGMKIIENKKTSLSFGITFPDMFSIQDAFLKEVSKGAMEFSHQENVNVSFFPTPADEQNLSENSLLWRNLSEKRVNGLLLATRFPVRDIILLQQKKVPFVWLFNTLPHENIYSVLSDKFYAMKLAFDYFKHEKIKKLGFIQFSWEENELSTYREYLKDKGFSYDETLITTGNHIIETEEKEQGYQSAKKMLDLGVKGILVAGNSVLAGVVQAIAERELRIPEDIKLLVFSYSSRDYFISSLKIPQVLFPLKEGTVKALLLLKELVKKNKPEKKQIILRPCFIEST